MPKCHFKSKHKTIGFFNICNRLCCGYRLEVDRDVTFQAYALVHFFQDFPYKENLWNQIEDELVAKRLRRGRYRLDIEFSWPTKRRLQSQLFFYLVVYSFKLIWFWYSFSMRLSFECVVIEYYYFYRTKCCTTRIWSGYDQFGTWLIGAESDDSQWVRCQSLVCVYMVAPWL